MSIKIKHSDETTYNIEGIRNGSFAQDSLRNTRSVTTGAVAGFGVGFLTGFFMKKSKLMFGLIGSFAGMGIAILINK